MQMAGSMQVAGSRRFRRGTPLAPALTLIWLTAAGQVAPGGERRLAPG